MDWALFHNVVIPYAIINACLICPALVNNKRLPRSDKVRENSMTAIFLVILKFHVNSYLEYKAR
jgi:hypothetical protein